MTFLAIDLWDKKVGIAISVEWVSVPKEIIPRPKIVAYLKKILEEYGITHIVVGLPYDLYGRDDKQLKKTEKFIEKLILLFPEQKIVGHDERFTSFEAKKDRRSDEYIDDVSAWLILESFMRENNIS